ncbi:hypothetical protein FAVG1_02965 [Fusarium avenaceum]|nr:hypothetical protein FAVG1_02965 [Fusarium avenaceum]
MPDHSPSEEIPSFSSLNISDVTEDKQQEDNSISSVMANEAANSEPPKSSMYPDLHNYVAESLDEDGLEYSFRDSCAPIFTTTSLRSLMKMAWNTHSAITAKRSTLNAPNSSIYPDLHDYVAEILDEDGLEYSQVGCNLIRTPSEADRTT